MFIKIAFSYAARLMIQHWSTLRMIHCGIIITFTCARRHQQYTHCRASLLRHRSRYLGLLLQPQFQFLVV